MREINDMDSKENIPIKLFGQAQADVLFKILVFQRLCPRKFLIEEPWSPDDLTEEEVEGLRSALWELMPLDTMVTDMWDWNIHFETSTFADTYFDVALGPEDVALAEAESLQEDILHWIDEYGMDYAQDQVTQEEFEAMVLTQCREFMLKWRGNIVGRFAEQ